MLLTAVELLRISGAADALTRLLAPLSTVLGIPAETLPLLLIRPLSGSAALAVGADLMAAHGPDSPVGRTAAILLGSTETTFYTVSVYFSAAGIRKTRYAVPAALLADLTARTLLSPIELPIGVVTSIVGAVAFVIIFYKTRKVR